VDASVASLAFLPGIFTLTGRNLSGGQLAVFVYWWQPGKCQTLRQPGRIYHLDRKWSNLHPDNSSQYFPPPEPARAGEGYCSTLSSAAVMRLILFIGVTSVFLSWLLGQQQ
jgi:hypothetical protein